MQRVHRGGTAIAEQPLQSVVHALRKSIMKSIRNRYSSQQGKIGWILLWLLGVPIPVLLLLFLLRGCT